MIKESAQQTRAESTGKVIFLSNLKAKMNFKKVENVFRLYLLLQPCPIIPKNWGV